jgi:hypothetical protein
VTKFLGLATCNFSLIKKKEEKKREESERGKREESTVTKFLIA